MRGASSRDRNRDGPGAPHKTESQDFSPVSLTSSCQRAHCHGCHLEPPSFSQRPCFSSKRCARQYLLPVAVVSTAAPGAGRGQTKDLGGSGHVRKQMPHMNCCHDACNRVGRPSYQLRTSGRLGEGPWGAEGEKPGPDAPGRLVSAVQLCLWDSGEGCVSAAPHPRKGGGTDRVSLGRFTRCQLLALSCKGLQLEPPLRTR